MGVLSLFITEKDDDFGLKSTKHKDIYRHQFTHTFCEGDIHLFLFTRGFIFVAFKFLKDTLVLSV